MWNEGMMRYVSVNSGLRTEALAFSCLQVTPWEAQFTARLIRKPLSKKSRLLTYSVTQGKCLLHSHFKGFLVWRKTTCSLPLASQHRLREPPGPELSRPSSKMFSKASVGKGLSFQQDLWATLPFL